MKRDAMTCEECLRGILFEPTSWLIVIVGLALAMVLGRFSMLRLAAAVALVAILCGVAWSYGVYEMSCIELYEG
jgi:hypothetical protein